MANPDEYDDAYLNAVNDALTGDRKELFDYLYQCLSIIDGKAASLLQFNGIIIAVSAVLMLLLGEDRNKTQPWFNLATGATTLVVVLMLISSMMSLRVVWVYWAKTADIVGDRYVRELLDRRTRRTMWHERSWLVSFWSLPLFLLDLLLVFSMYLR